MKRNRDNASGRFVSRLFARLHPATTSAATIHRDVVTDEMVEALAEHLWRTAHGHWTDRPLSANDRHTIAVWTARAREYLLVAFAARKDGS